MFQVLREEPGTDFFYAALLRRSLVYLLYLPVTLLRVITLQESSCSKKIVAKICYRLFPAKPEFTDLDISLSLSKACKNHKNLQN